MGLFDGGFLGELFKKGATELTNSLSKGLDNLFTNDEERAAKANELARIKAEMEATYYFGSSRQTKEKPTPQQ